MDLDTAESENSSNGSHVVPCGITYGQWIDTTNIIVVFRNFVNAPEKERRNANLTSVAQVLFETVIKCRSGVAKTH